MKPADFLRAIDRAHRTPRGACPRCQKPLNHATGGDQAPSPGDVAVCFICEALLEFQPGLSFRLMTDAEVAALSDETLLSLLDSIETARIMRKVYYQRIQAPTP